MAKGMPQGNTQVNIQAVLSKGMGENFHTFLCCGGKLLQISE
jgi:hypothetical protein